MIDWDKEFPIATSVSRREMKEAGFTEEQIAQLTDEDMAAIASEMEDWYCDNEFLNDLKLTVENMLHAKEPSRD